MRTSLSFFILSGLSLAAFGAGEEASTPAVSVEALVAEVVAGHPELKFYESELAAGHAGRRGAGSWADPELAVSFGRKEIREGTSGPTHDGAAWSVSLAQTFEWPGRLALRKAVADRDVALAELGLEGFRAELAAQVRGLAFGLIAAREKARAAEEVADRFRQLRETFLARESGGLTPQLEIRVIEAQELVLQRRATRAQLEIDAGLIALNQLRGAPPHSTLELAGGALSFRDAPDDGTLIGLARERNLAYRTRVLELERQGFRVSLAQHEGRPAITVAPFFEEENAGERERTFGVGVSLPLPVGRRVPAAAAAEESRLAQAEASVAAAYRELERAVLTASHAYRIHRADMARWSSGVIEAFRDAAGQADRHYRLGAVPVATYVELQASYLEALESLLDLRGDVLEAGMRLESLTGGAWRAVEVTP